MLYFQPQKIRHPDGDEERARMKQEVESEVYRQRMVLKSTGDSVAEGEVIMILESMKMEIPVEAPSDGTVVSILAELGDQVEEDQVVAVIEI